MFLNRILSFSFTLVFFVGFSQENSQKVLDTIKVNQLDEVVITATRTVRQLSSVPLAVTLISNKEIKKTGITRLKNILEEQTGIVFVTDASGFEGIQMQGLNSAYTLIMIDGVPIIGRSSGTLDLKRLTVNNIKQIEIVKGPSSSLYGSDAIGGVINIITDTANRDVSKGNIHYYFKGGKRNEQDLNSSYIYKKNKLGINAGINLNFSGGYDLSPNTLGNTTEPNTNFTANFGLNYKFNKKLKFHFSNRYYQQNQEVASTINAAKEYNLNAKISQDISGKFHLDYTFYATKYKTESFFNGDQSYYNQTLVRPEIRAIFKLDKSEIIGGIGASFDALDRTFFEKKESFKTQYVFGQFDYKPSQNLNVILGARFDHHNKYNSAFSPKISARYKVNDWFAIKSSMGFGFKAPDFRQLFFNFNNSAGGYIVYGVRTMHDLFGHVPEVINQVENNLNPENSVGYNLGFQLHPTHRLKINVNLFRNDIKDLINTAIFKDELPGINPNTQVFYYENRNKVYTQGIELDSKLILTDNFTISGGYQFLISKDKEEEDLIKSGVIYYRKTPNSPSQKLKIEDYFGLANRSKHTANLKVYYQNYEHNFDATIRAVYRSKYALYDTNNSQQIIDKYDNFVKGNVLVNTSFSKSIYNFAEVQIGIDNLLNSNGIQNEKLFPNNDSVLRIGRTFFGKIQINF
ncbi:TonB-dependent receptor plug domain-containing protein [Mesoflavibacter zeaxanthinifaciens]|uniref:TonB-dependent receptor plug domain-containing protein n=1 Tax=Mesoflavibacter zeaxanthinifaciens TaxID=393060 RepID=UPI003A90191D